MVTMTEDSCQGFKHKVISELTTRRKRALENARALAQGSYWRKGTTPPPPVAIVSLKASYVQEAASYSDLIRFVRGIKCVLAPFKCK